MAFKIIFFRSGLSISRDRMTEVPASAASPTAAGSYDWLLEEVGALVADAAEARKPELGLTASPTTF